MKKYELVWRNKWLTSGAKSGQEMVDMLKAAAEQLAELAGEKEIWSNMTAAGDDYVYFYTHNKNIAKKHGFDEVEDFEESTVEN